jgi:hypothetical protein
MPSGPRRWVWKYSSVLVPTRVGRMRPSHSALLP